MNKESLKLTKKSEMNKSRRRALFGAAGATAFAVWHKPIINSVVLPAHAQTSVAGPNFFAAPTQITFNNSNSFSPLDILVPKAHAGRRPGLGGRGAKATALGGNRYQIEIRNRRNTLARTGTLTVGEAGVLRPTAGSTCRFDIINPENDNGSTTGAIINSLMPPAHAGVPMPNSNGQRVEREATPWVAEIVEVTQNDIVLDISELGTTVIPAGEGMLPPLVACDDDDDRRRP